MAFRRTNGIVSDNGDPRKEADVIVTAATLGLAASHIAATKSPIQFDMDPLDAFADPKKTVAFKETVGKLDDAVAAYLAKNNLAPSSVKCGTSPGYHQGTVIMGVYKLAGQSAPESLAAPKLSKEGEKLWAEIWQSNTLKQYKGRGAYSGFVDNRNTEGDTRPIGPLPTARFVAKKDDTKLPSRWLPPDDSLLWDDRLRFGKDKKDKEAFVPWGMIGGDKAKNGPTDKDKPEYDKKKATNEADFITACMLADGMKFHGDVTKADIPMYPHGMIQAIYKAYGLGPNCAAYEILVGSKTTKAASCLPCTLFMCANGYPPTSIHLGRAESWAPLFAPDPQPDPPNKQREEAVIRDLNNSWYEKCIDCLKMGLDILDDAHITEDHKTSRDAVKKYITDHATDTTVGGGLILDAMTIHEGEIDRISRTLKPPAVALSHQEIGTDLFENIRAVDDTQWGAAVIMSSSAGLSTLMVPDVANVGTAPVYITKKVSIEFKHLVEFLKTKEITLPKPINDLLADLSISCDAFYYSTDTLLLALVVSSKTGLLSSLTGYNNLEKLFDIKGAMVRVVKCPKDKLAELQNYIKMLSAPSKTT